MRSGTNTVLGMVTTVTGTDVGYDSPDSYWDSVVLATHMDGENDPYAANVLLGLHMEGSDASTVFTEVTGKTVTAVGNAKLSTAISKFGKTSLSLDGSGDYLSLPNTSDFDFPGAFAIEAWVYLNAYDAANSTVFSRYFDYNNTGYRIYVAGNGVLCFYCVDNGGTARALYGAVIPTNTWRHVALTYDGTTYRIFTEGVLNSSLVAPAPKAVGTSMAPYIGTTNTTAWFFNGYIDDFRITKGVARYTATFNPPTVQFGSFKDLKGKDLLVNGNAKISTTQSKFGGTSVCFNGSNDYLTITSSVDWNLGTEDFTVEGWVRLDTLNGLQVFIDRYDATAYSWQLAINGGKLNAYIRDGAGTGSVVSYTCPTISLAANVWSHIAYVRMGGVIYFYVDGVTAGSVAANQTLTSASLPLTIGKQGNSDNYFFKGYIDDLRITKGIARYTTYFTPPTKEFSRNIYYSGRELLQANRTYYVSANGSDTNTGISSLSPYATIQKAVDTVCNNLSLMGYTVTIQVADGTYTTSVMLKPLPDYGGIIIQGNATNPSNVVISTTSANCFNAVTPRCSYIIKDMKLQTATSGGGLSVSQGAYIAFGNLVFGASAGTHIYCDNSRLSCISNYTISGSAPYHFLAYYAGVITVASKTITITGTPSFTQFAVASYGAVMNLTGNTYSGSATGTYYYVSQNGVIASGVQLPGNAAGTVHQGGTYY